MAIDDLANRSHDCDILLDQNLCKDEKNRYRNLVPQDCRTLIGPNYALLHPKYAKYASKLTRNNNQIKKIFIFFGGSDPDNMTLLTLQALSCLELRDIDLDIVIGANNPFRSSIEYYANQRMRTKIYGELPHLAELMSEADMAIGAGGTTALERMVLGLPSLVITIAENQVPVSKLLNEIGAIRLVGNSKNVDIETIKTVTYDEITSKGYLNLSKKSRTLCDGNGVFRVRDEIIKLYS
jgi:UDP-2,4-diacetamido-2,4,6-trideoxy-beta-L-altropyranose hydrolase